MTGVTAPEPLAAGDVLNIGSGGLKRFVGTTFTNQGTVNWLADNLQAGNGASVTNAGLWDVKGDNSLIWAFGGQPTFTNTGTFRKSAGVGTTTPGSWNFQNNGGTIDAQTGTIDFSGSSNAFNAGTMFRGAGVTRISGNSAFNGNFQSDNLLLAGGTFSGTNAALAGGVAAASGAVTWSGGDLAGTWTIGSGNTLTAIDGGAKRQVGSDLVNNGTILWNSTASLQGGNSSVLTNNGVFEARQSATVTWNFGGQAAFGNNATGIVRADNNSTLTFGSVALTSNGGLFEATSGSAIVYTGASNRFNDGTRFLGNTTVEGNARFVDNIFSDDLRFVSGAQTGGDGTAGSRGRFAGQVGWEAGDLAGNFEIKSGATLTASGGGAKRQVGSDLVNNGTILWNSAASLQGGNTSVLTNNGVFEARQSATVTWNFGGQAAFGNNATGIVRADNNSTLTFGSVALTSNGGLFEATSGSAIVFSGSTNRFNDGTRFLGNTAVEGNARFVDLIQSSNLRLVSGTQTGGDGTAGSRGRFAGQVGWEAGDLAGNFEIKSGATMTASGGGAKRQVGSDVVNNGTILWNSTASLQGGNSSVLTNNGVFNVSTDASIAWVFGGQAAFANHGTFIKSGGMGETSIASLAFSNHGTVDVQSGAIRLPGVFSNDGTLTGCGTLVSGQLNNVGVIAPGGISSTGTLTLAGNLFNTGEIAFQFGGLGAGMFDILAVTGTAAFSGGIISFDFSGFSPSAGDSWDFLYAPVLTGWETNQFMFSGLGPDLTYAFDYANGVQTLRLLRGAAGPVPEGMAGSETLALMATALSILGYLRRRFAC
ncbi:MAG: hypothetical protein JNL39_10060 [Opitutaceae bacterium]|nr:hypothetical protein [Opitutaceae bacterium]